MPFIILTVLFLSLCFHDSLSILPVPHDINCKSDSDCVGDWTCIQVVEKDCGSVSCLSRSVCVTPEEKTCENIGCVSSSPGCVNILPDECSSCQVEPYCLPGTAHVHTYCQYNTDCAPSGKCIKVVERNCTSTSCPTRPVCSSMNEITCKNMLCEAGSPGCIDILPKKCTFCSIQSECLPSAPVVSDKDLSCDTMKCRPGEKCVDVNNCGLWEFRCIPKHECVVYDDSQLSCGLKKCRYGEKCVDLNNCGMEETNCVPKHTCVSEKAETCEFGMCDPGKKCVMLYPPCLLGAKCEPKPVCQDKLEIPRAPDIKRCRLQGGGEGMCTKVFRSDCITTGCPKKNVCISPYTQTCRTTKCMSGLVCVDIQYPCWTRPCPVKPKCVSKRSYPAFEASSKPIINNVPYPEPPSEPDSIPPLPEPHTIHSPLLCKHNKKCTLPGGKPGYCQEVAGFICESFGCEKRLECIPADGPGCHKIQCEKCVNIQSPCARMSVPCTYEPKCFSGGPKPGKCPKLDNEVSICAISESSCSKDDECPLDQKCCTRGCGKECVKPEDDSPDLNGFALK